MSRIEEIRNKINEQNLDEILSDFNTILENYSLSNVEVVGFRVGEKTEPIKSSQAPLIKNFNEALERKGLQDAYVADFTLAVAAGREGICHIEIKGAWIEIKCGQK